MAQHTHPLQMLYGHTAHRYRRHRLHQQVAVECSALQRRRPGKLPGLQSGTGSDDRLAMATHPATELRHARRLRWRNAPLTVGPDIEQQVAAATGHFAQGMHQRGRRLVMIVLGVEPPAHVHGQAGFPGLGRWFGRHELLRRRKIAMTGKAIVDQDVWLQLADQSFEAIDIPHLGATFPGAIEPDHVDGAIISKQLSDLPTQIGLIRGPAFGRRRRIAAKHIGPHPIGEGRIIGMVPIGQRVIEADLQAMAPAGPDEGTNNIGTRSRLGDSMLAMPAGPQRIAVVVTGREHGIAHAGGCSSGNPGFWRSRVRLPTIGVGMVGFGRNILPHRQGDDTANERPAGFPAGAGPRAPMDEQAKAGRFKPMLRAAHCVLPRYS